MRGGMMIKYSNPTWIQVKTYNKLNPLWGSVVWWNYTPRVCNPWLFIFNHFVVGVVTETSYSHNQQQLLAPRKSSKYSNNFHWIIPKPLPIARQHLFSSSQLHTNHFSLQFHPLCLVLLTSTNNFIHFIRYFWLSQIILSAISNINNFFFRKDSYCLNQ